MTYRSVSVRLSAEVAGYIANMTRAGAATRRAIDGGTTSIGRHNKALAVMGVVGRTSGIAVAGGIALAVKEAADFNAKMALVQTLSHANAREMTTLSHAARTVGTGFGYTATEVADGEAEMIKAGVSLKDIMGGGLRGTLALAAAGQTDVATASSIAAAAMTQFGLKGRDIPHVADLLAAGADKALGSVEDLGNGLEQAGTTAHQMGFSIEDTTGTLTEFAQAGLIGERGGTILKQMLLQLAAPTQKAQDLMHKYGLSLYDANGNMKSMPQLAGNMQTAFENLTPKQRNYALGVIFGSRAIQGANVLLKDGEVVNRRWINSVNDQGFAAQQASGKLNSLQGDMQKLKAVGENALISLGQGAQGPLRHMVQDVTTEIGKLTRDHTLERWGHNIGAGIGAAVHVVGQLADGLGHLSHAYSSLPDIAQKGLLVGGVAALAQLRYGGGLGRGRGVAGAAGALTGARGGVVPVFVTNMGAGGMGAGGDTVLGGPGGKAASRLFRFRGASALPMALTLGAASMAAGGIHGGAGSFTRGALTGAALGSFLGPEGALAGGAIGGGIGLARYGHANSALGKFDAAKDSKSVTKLADAYQALQKEQDGFAERNRRVGLSARSANVNTSKMNDILAKLHDETGLSGKALRAFAEGSVYAARGTHKLGLTMSDMQFEAQKAGVSAGQLGHMMHSLPAAVRTKILTPGALESKASIRALGRQFGLTPKQIQTIIKLVGIRDAQDKTKATQRGLRTLNQTTAKPKVETQGTEESQTKAKKVSVGLRTLNQQSTKPKVTLNDQASGPIKHVSGELDGVGAKHPRPTIDVRDLASGAVRAAEAVLAGFNGRHAVATITTQHITTHQAITIPGITKPRGHPYTGGYFDHGTFYRRAGGGPVFGAGTATSDSIPAYLSNGEYVIKAAAVAKYGVALFDRMNSMKLAGGGPVGLAGGGSVHLDKQQNAELQKLNDRLAKLTDQIKQDLDSRKQYKSTVSQAYVSDPFGGTLGGFDAQMRYETNRIRGGVNNLALLKKHGLGGALFKDLAASGNATLISQFAGLSRSQLDARERAYSARNRYDRQIGGYSATQVMGPAMDNLGSEIDRLRSEIHELRTTGRIGNTNIRNAVIRDTPTKQKTKTAATKARHGR